MKSARFVCLFVILGSIMLAAQSNPAGLISLGRPVPSSLPSGLSKPDAKTQSKILESYGKLPLTFERNQGQINAQVKFLSRGSGYTLFLTGDEAVFSLRGGTAKDEVSPLDPRSSATHPRLRPSTSNVPTTRDAVLRMKLVNANPAAEITGTDELPGRSNYFIGNDAKQWQANVPMYAKVKYKNIYSGVDLVYYGNQRQLEYDFVVAPGADPHHIQFDVRGAKKISRRENGDLVAQLDADEMRWHKPVVYQEKDGTRQEIAAHYVIKENRVGFAIAGYDSRQPLFIDPLVYSTYLGGSAFDIGNGIAVDTSGNAYVTGSTNSSNFPTMNPLQPANAGGPDVFVAKFNPTGSALVYSTYLGGSGDDRSYGIAVDSSGDAYLTGSTDSTDFPTMNPLQPANAGGGDLFVTKLNPTGSALVYSTYLGGTGVDYGYNIATDSLGNAYVTGQTFSTDFPTINPLQPANAGNGDLFVTKLNPTGSALAYSTYLGGSDYDIGEGIAVDSSGNAYVTGITVSTDFPTMNPLQPANAGGGDVFVTELNPAGSALVYSTYLGGSGSDGGYSITVDSSGNAYVTGQTSSTDFPTLNPWQPANAGKVDVFVTKLNPAGSALVYSTYLGGSEDDFGHGIAVDSTGNASLAGWTRSTDFPTMNPLQGANAGPSDAFVSKLTPSGSALVYSTYLGGSREDFGEGIAVDSSGVAYMTGFTQSIDFPTMNALQPAYGGGNYDAFVVKINTNASAAVTLAPLKLDLGNQTVGFTSAPQKSTLTNIGELTLTITSINVTGLNSGDFAEKDNCGTVVSPKGSCDITVTFTPTAVGSRNAAVSITDNAPGSPQQLPLSGVGVLPAVTFSPTSLTFPTQLVFTTSQPRRATLTNTGQGILLISQIAVSGEFTQTSDCGKSVPPGGHCTISVRFQPQKKGVLRGTLSVTDNAPGSPQTAPLKGTSTYVSLTPAKTNFGTQPVGTKSLPKTITLTNKGDGPVNIQSISISGLDAGDFAEKNNCGHQVPSGASCFIKVTFKPTKKGQRTADVSISDDGGGSPQKAKVTGTGT
jgi:hypothetical protein